MKRLTYILLIHALLLIFSHNVSATVQTRDIILIDRVEHKLNKVLLYQLDSVTYCVLKNKLNFSKSSYSGNWRGHISTFEVKGNKLFLNNITTSKEHADFKGLLDKYMDKNGRVFASWVSGSFICGTGECIYVTKDGLDSVYERETELVVEKGVVISLRTYCNKACGTLYLDDAQRIISQKLDLSKIKVPKGRVTVKINASRFSEDGKVIEWSVEFLQGHNALPGEIKDQIVKEVNRVFNLMDWKTFCRDGKWHWLYQDNITYPLIFK